MGPMSVRVASYFPFNVTCYLNGHSFVAQELRREGVRFRKADNAFLAVGDVVALGAAADRLSAAVLQRRCNYWVRRVVPVFSPAERAALRPAYRCSARSWLPPMSVASRNRLSCWPVRSILANSPRWRLRR